MPALLDLTATSRVPFTRLVVVELRKARDTRAGFWLLVCIIGLLTLVPDSAVVVTLVRHDPTRLDDFVGIAAYMCSWLLPFLAIMLVTNEWSQRTALVTFTLEPRRPRIVWAKLVATLLLSVANLVGALLVGVACTAVCEAVQPDWTSWHLLYGNVAGFFVTAVLAMLGGFAIATLLLNTPASIVLFVVYRFVLPGVFVALEALSDTLARVLPWVDFQGAQLDIPDWSMSGAAAWGHLIVSGMVWLVLPLGLGVRRLVTAELT